MVHENKEKAKHVVTTIRESLRSRMRGRITRCTGYPEEPATRRESVSPLGYHRSHMLRGLRLSRSPSDRPLMLLLALPLVLLLCNSSWIWDSPIYFDTNVYVGFFRHYLEFKMPYIANYKSSRLPFVLPGVLLYRLLPGSLAHHSLHLTFLWGETLAVYALIKPRFGAHAAFVAAAAVVTSTYSHTLTSYHNQAASTYFVLALLLLERPVAWNRLCRAAAAGGALAFALTTDSVVVLLGPLFIMHAVGVLGPSRSVRRVVVSLLSSGAGAVGAIAALGLLNRILGGPFTFFLEQIHYALDVAKGGALSQVPLAAIMTQVYAFPWLALPMMVGIASAVYLARAVLRRRFDWGALQTAGYLTSLVLAALAEARGTAVLEQHCLFHVFLAPMYLALGALLGTLTPREQPDSQPKASFLVMVAVCFVAPLSICGAPLSRLLVNVGKTWPAAARGVPFAFALGALGAFCAWRWRQGGSFRVLTAAGALGLINAICTEPSQPAELYQIGVACPFRGETFDALLEADEVISGFDPNNEARWKSTPEPYQAPMFDGHDWCHLLPLQTVSRSVLLTHYFYTSAELVHGVAPSPLKKVTVVAMSAPEMAALVADTQTGVPAGYSMKLKADREFRHSTFTLFVRGYDVVPTGTGPL